MQHYEFWFGTAIEYLAGALPKLHNFTYIAIVLPKRAEVPRLQTSTCMTFSTVSTRVPCIRTKAGVIRLLYPKDVVVHQNILLFIIILTSGDSTDTLGLTAEGITGRVLLILCAVILPVVAVPLLIIAAVFLHGDGKPHTRIVHCDF